VRRRRVESRPRVTAAAPPFRTRTLGANVRPRRYRAGAALPGDAAREAAETTSNRTGVGLDATTVERAKDPVTVTVASTVVPGGRPPEGTRAVKVIRCVVPAGIAVGIAGEGGALSVNPPAE
jgi:hypothetical protein